MWLLARRPDLARGELASAALAFPREARILRPLVSLDGALGLAESKREHLEDLCLVDRGLAEKVFEDGIESVLGEFPDRPPAQEALAGITLEEELFARFPEGREGEEFAGAAAVAMRDAEAANKASGAVFASCAMSSEKK